MGNNSSSSNSRRNCMFTWMKRKRPSTIMMADGSSFKLEPPATVSDAIANHPDYVVMESEEVKRLGVNAVALHPDHPLKPNKLYFIVKTPQGTATLSDAVSHLGIKHAVPKTIMQLMSVEGLTRENVASHLQKYRLYLKRMQGISSGGVGSHASVSHSDEQLFASGPIPHHFLSQRPAPVGGGCGGGGGGGGGGPDPFMPFVQVSALHQHHHHQMAAAAVAAHHQQQQFYHHRHIGSVGSTPNFEHHGSLLPRQPQQGGMQRMVGPLSVGLMPTMAGVSGLAEDSDSAATAAGRDGRRVLTLFPTNDD